MEITNQGSMLAWLSYRCFACLSAEDGGGEVKYAAFDWLRSLYGGGRARDVVLSAGMNRFGMRVSSQSKMLEVLACRSSGFNRRWKACTDVFVVEELARCFCGPDIRILPSCW